MDKNVRKLATAARREIESFARKHEGVGSRYDLECLCGIASYFLVMVGRRYGYKMSLVEGIAFDYEAVARSDGPNHCWVEYDGQIIDLTATQFDKRVQKVHIVDTDNEEYYGLTRNNEARRNLRDEWPDEQSPYEYITELRQRVNKIKDKIPA